jgi:hypothetical protein
VRISIGGVTNEGSTPVAPAFGTDTFGLVVEGLVGCVEVGQEGVVRLHGDDLPFVRPYLLEQGEQELASSDAQLPRARSAPKRARTATGTAADAGGEKPSPER